MLDFCGEHEIGCGIERIAMQPIHEAYERMFRPDVNCRFVVDLAALKRSAGQRTAGARASRQGYFFGRATC